MPSVRFFQSGTPRVDKWQVQENGLCTHRLFSMHGAYEAAVLKWLEHPKNGIASNLDKPRPKFVMLDSGAFTSWRSGHITTVAEVLPAYGKFFDKAQDYFEDIYAINLDKIPGSFGVDPTEEEIKEAIQVSDENFKVLVDKFGPRILPVYHQGENLERVLQLEEMVNGRGNYICVSPRNDLPEGKRWPWAQQVHSALQTSTKTHGLATTGNLMLERVPWHSVDSATWKLAAVYGKIVHFWDTGNNPKYVLIAISNEGGLDRFQGNHYDSLAEPYRLAIQERIEALGFTVEQVKTDIMPRSLYNMSELERFMSAVHNENRVHSYQATLFGV